ncbi:MAG: oligopeptide transporter, OPT family [Ignavibacteriae bacterium]|nr:oligopeptide transporter, OPT family [Ignavibacteriota bacterium]
MHEASQVNRPVTKQVKPYVPAETSLKELTFKSLLLGVLMAAILGAANAYLGLKAGMTVSATFPAAVVAMAALRLFRGSILEENVARTTASVGEALVAGAIFTIPAFLMVGAWKTFNYWESVMIMIVGGVLGVLLIIFLRRALIEEAVDLPYPESVATAEMVKAGQKGETGAKFVFGAAGLAAMIELFKNPRGIQLIGESWGHFYHFAKSKIQFFQGATTPLGDAQTYGGGIFLSTPVASPALMGVGYIIGPRLAAIAFSGGLFGWWVLIPIALFFNSGLEIMAAGGIEWDSLLNEVWRRQVRPMAVGAMLVGAAYTLFKLRHELRTGLGKAFTDFRIAEGGQTTVSRLSLDLPMRWIIPGIIAMVVPITILYEYFSSDWLSAVVAAIVMLLTGFVMSAIAGYLVGLMGGSNNPISGLTLSSLVIAAVLMVMLGVTGLHGVTAVLGVAAVVCCACGIAGDMLQDMKVGQILGGTPKKMQIAEIIGVIVAAFVLPIPMQILHDGTPGGIGGPSLPAPQAGLMSIMAQGIVGGDMAWPLLLMGAAFAVVLILLRAPSVMLIAVGIYLPFETTFAIFAGGLIRLITDKIVERRKLASEDRVRVENRGILLASGLVAGEALTGVLLASIVLLNWELPHISDNPILGLTVFPIIALVLIGIPLRKLMKA